VYGRGGRSCNLPRYVERAQTAQMPHRKLTQCREAAPPSSTRRFPSTTSSIHADILLICKQALESLRLGQAPVSTQLRSARGRILLFMHQHRWEAGLAHPKLQLHAFCASRIARLSVRFVRSCSQASCKVMTLRSALGMFSKSAPEQVLI
jgi:hypothetical protein